MLTKKIVFASLLSASVLMTKAQNATFNDLKKTPSFQVVLQADTSPAAFKLFVNNPAKKNLKLTISHNDMGVVVDTVINSQEYQGRYTFDEAMDGRYRITVENGKEKFSKQIEL